MSIERKWHAYDEARSLDDLFVLPVFHAYAIFDGLSFLMKEDNIGHACRLFLPTAVAMSRC